MMMAQLVFRYPCTVGLSIRSCSYCSLSHNTSSKKTAAGIKHDIIGPPDKFSNLRPTDFYLPPNETPLQKEYRELRMYAQNWNQKFWSNHNSKFIKEREEFLASNRKADQSTLSADEMSVFYKSFLDKNWKTHINYNVHWYKMNIDIFLLSVKVVFEKILNKFK